MKLWKQSLLSLLVLGGALAAWAAWYPGADEIIGRYGFSNYVSAAIRNARESGAREAASGQQNAGNRPGRNGFSRETLVLVAEVSEGVVNDRLKAIGSGQAARTVAIRPLVDGQIDSIPVVSGAHVEAGDIVLRLDSAEEALAVEQARQALADAEAKALRLGSLLSRNAISSVEVENARSEAINARLALRAAELALSRRTIRAPISGTLGMLAVNAGDYVTTQNDIATIDDREEILVEFFVPERFASAMLQGTPVVAEAIAFPGERFEGAIAAVDNRIDATSRTLRVRARIPNTDERLRAGMSFEISMAFKGETFPLVDPLSVQWDSTGPYVWLVAEGTAERRAVAIVQRNADGVLVRGGVEAGDIVVTEGVQNVRQGARVRIADESPENGVARNRQANPAGNGG